MKYWIGVVSQDHAQKAIESGFAQVCHGKRAPLARMGVGDGFIYYSPYESLKTKKPYRQFTGVGHVISGNVYQVTMSDAFKPFRIDIEFHPAIDVPIKQLVDKLELTHSNRHWGMALRRGHIEISETDFTTIAYAMQSCQSSD